MGNNTVKIINFYPEKCTGCMKCEEACSLALFKNREGREASAIHIIKKGDSFTSNVCNQCGLCIDVCSVGAIKRLKNNIVWIDPKICIGCQACVAFCPIDAMRQNTTLRLEPFKCISCGQCIKACPEDALDFKELPVDEVKKIVYYKQGG